jgi:hypothetical protein
MKVVAHCLNGLENFGGSFRSETPSEWVSKSDGIECMLILDKLVLMSDHASRSLDSIHGLIDDGVWHIVIVGHDDILLGELSSKRHCREGQSCVDCELHDV